jgi:peptide/nickel transport system ATP-binding protein
VNSELLVSVKNLEISFSEQAPVVKSINFDIQKGEILGIVGESGSGKSVTCLSIIRLLAKTAHVKGEIYFDGVDLNKISEDEMVKLRGKGISMIFQEPMSSLNPSHRCGDQVLEAILIHQSISKNEAKDKVIALFEEVKIEDAERAYKAYPHQLSGGQLQRVMIAMAISNYPRLIIADEPTTALDVTVQRDIIDLLHDIKLKYNSSIVFISHDLGVVRNIADRIVVMNEGEIVETAKTNALFESPKHPYTKGLLACRPPLKYRVKRLPTVDDFLNKDPEQLSKYLEDNQDTIDNWKENNKKIYQKEPLLVVEELCKWYPIKTNFWGKPVDHFKALNNVSFTINKGEVLGLVGESGSGKTTCGRSLLKLIAPTSGNVNFDGHDVFNLSSKALRNLRKDFQIIFQDPYSSLNPRIRVGDAIMEPMHIHEIGANKAERKAKAMELLKEVGLEEDHFNRYPHQFSGGQRQRICIARTLSLNPKFIVCDESVSALDVSVQAQILNLLLDLKDKYDLSYLFISHDISVIKFLCDNVIVMKGGEIVEKASAEDIYHNPQHPYTKQLISAVYD